MSVEKILMFKNLPRWWVFFEESSKNSFLSCCIFCIIYFSSAIDSFVVENWHQFQKFQKKVFKDVKVLPALFDYYFKKKHLTVNLRFNIFILNWEKNYQQIFYVWLAKQKIILKWYLLYYKYFFCTFLDNANIFSQQNIYCLNKPLLN